MLKIQILQLIKYLNVMMYFEASDEQIITYAIVMERK